MGLITSALPTIGDPNSTEDVDVRTLLSDLKTLVNGNIDDTNINAASYVAGNAQLWRPVLQTYAAFNTNSYASATTYLVATGGTVTAGVASGGVPTFYYLASEFPALGSKSVKFRVSTNLLVGSNAPGINLIFGLYAITNTTGTTPVAINPGTVFASSTTTFSSPAANSKTHVNSSDLTGLVDGSFYACGFSVSGAGAASSGVMAQVNLEYKYT